MKLLLLLLISFLVLHNGTGAPRDAVYKFLKCNPTGDRTNCVTHQSPEMEWSPELPGKLPASTAQNMEAEPVEDEKPQTEEEDEEMLGDEAGSALIYLPEEESSGFYEGSAAEGSFVEQPSGNGETDTGSGEPWSEKHLNLYKVDNKKFLRWFRHHRPMSDGANQLSRN